MLAGIRLHHQTGQNLTLTFGTMFGGNLTAAGMLQYRLVKENATMAETLNRSASPTVPNPRLVRALEANWQEEMEGAATYRGLAAHENDAGAQAGTAGNGRVGEAARRALGRAAP